MDLQAREKGGRAPDLSSMDTLVSVVARLRRSLAEDEQACASLENLKAETKREQDSTRTEIEHIRERVQTMEIWSPQRAVVVENLTSSLDMMVEQLHTEETENARLREREQEQRDKLESLYRHYLTQFNEIRVRYSGRLVDNTQQEYKQKMEQLSERKIAAISSINYLMEDRTRRTIEDWAAFKEVVIKLLKSRKRLQAICDGKRQLENLIEAANENIQKKEREMKEREAEGQSLKKHTSVWFKLDHEQKPPRIVSSLQEKSQKQKVLKMVATTCKGRRDTPRPNRFDTGLGLLRKTKVKEKSRLTFSPEDLQSEEYPESHSAILQSADPSSNQGPKNASGQSGLQGISPDLPQRHSMGQATMSFASQDSSSEEERTHDPSRQNVGQKNERYHMQISSISSDGKSFIDQSCDRPHTSSFQESSPFSNSSVKDISTSAHMADVSNFSESLMGESSSSSSSIRNLERERSAQELFYTPPSVQSNTSRDHHVSSLPSSPRFHLGTSPFPSKSVVQSMRTTVFTTLSNLTEQKDLSSDVRVHSHQFGGKDPERKADFEKGQITNCSSVIESNTSVEAEDAEHITSCNVDSGSTAESRTTEENAGSLSVQADSEMELDDSMESMIDSSQRQSSQGFSIEGDDGDNSATSDIDSTKRSSIGDSERHEDLSPVRHVLSVDKDTSNASSLSFPPREPHPFSHSTPAIMKLHSELHTSSMCVEPPLSRNVSKNEENPSTPILAPEATMQSESVHIPKLPAKRDLFYSLSEVSQPNSPMLPPVASFSPAIDWNSPLYSSYGGASMNSQATSESVSDVCSSGKPFSFMSGGRTEESRISTGALSLFGSPDKSGGRDETREEGSSVNFSLFGDSQPSQEPDFGGGGFFSFSFGRSQTSPDTSSSSSRGFLSSLFDGSSPSSASGKDQSSSSGAEFKLF